MDRLFDTSKTLEIIEELKFQRIGENKKWNAIIKKIKNNKSLDKLDLEYFSTLTRIYKDSVVTSRSKIYHTKLSQYDEKPGCEICGTNSAYYCNINDQYFCLIHVVGHDENEF